ncbi:MAG: DUF2752 domain-containing protein [Candidatus Riflebacteria bacterium]|nr:DUF2752 domain-containing protein [Candidatus Riflebacteria bacterium]
MIDRAARRRRFVLGLALLGAFPLAGLLRPFLGSLVPGCSFRVITGRPCIFCGLTRALASAWHGDVTGAFGLNPLWGLAALAVMATGLAALRDAAQGTDHLSGLARVWDQRSWVIIGALALATLARVLLG